MNFPEKLPTLSEEDIKAIDALDRGERTVKPGKSGKLLGWTLEELGW